MCRAQRPLLRYGRLGGWVGRVSWCLRRGGEGEGARPQEVRRALLRCVLLGDARACSTRAARAPRGGLPLRAARVLRSKALEAPRALLIYMLPYMERIGRVSRLRRGGGAAPAWPKMRKKWALALALLALLPLALVRVSRAQEDLAAEAQILLPGGVAQAQAQAQAQQGESWMLVGMMSACCDAESLARRAMQRAILQEHLAGKMGTDAAPEVRRLRGKNLF